MGIEGKLKGKASILEGSNLKKDQSFRNRQTWGVGERGGSLKRREHVILSKDAGHGLSLGVLGWLHKKHPSASSSLDWWFGLVWREASFPFTIRKQGFKSDPNHQLRGTILNPGIQAGHHYNAWVMLT